MRQLFLWHRWFGIGLCLFMALWFLSGMVMLFVGYPKLTPTEHLQRLPLLSAEHSYIDVDQAIIAATNPTLAPEAITLSSVAGKAHYLVQYSEQPTIAIDALSGQPMQTVDAELALASAQAFHSESLPVYLGLIESNAWTKSRALDAERPLHVVKINDKAKRILYISSHNGRVVRDATQHERTWGWLGAWLHWLYPLREMPWWTNLIIYLSLAATFMALMGQIIGVKRWRFTKRFNNGSHSPYRSGYARWHHIGGLIFGVILIAWIFSGLMSMQPWGVFANQSKLDINRFQGGNLQSIQSPWTINEIMQRFYEAKFQPRELKWAKINGQSWVAAYDGNEKSLLIPLFGAGKVTQQVPFFTLKQAIETISPQPPTQLEWLTEYDFYYFARAEQSMYGDRTRPLPILRVKFSDEAQSWLHIDPNGGVVLEQVDKQRRIARWLFNLLHSWDWQPLLERRLLRETLITLFSLGGLLICVSGTVMGWRRLRRQAKQSQSKLKQGL